MKSPQALVISILLNVALLLVIFGKSSTPSSPHEEKNSAPVQSRTAPAQPEKETITVRTVVTNTVSLNWSIIESEDYKRYIQNLRDVKCPEETIRDIIMADVNKTFLKRWEASAVPKDWKYWKGEESVFLSPAVQQGKMTLQKERDALLKELLDIDYPLEASKLSWLFADTRSVQLGFLPPEKQEAVKRIYDKYRSLNIANATAGDPTPADRKKAKERRNQEMAEVAQLLTPEEWENYQLRSSSWSQMARQGLVGMEVTEDEFRRLYRQNRALSDERSNLDYETNKDGATQRSRNLTDLMNENTKAILGEQRFKDFRRSQDFSFQGLVLWGSRLGLSRESAATLYDTQHAFQAAASKLQMERTLAVDQRKEARNALVSEAEKNLRSVLNEDAYQAYKSQYGSWLR